MSISGALMGFAVASIIVGIIGSIATGALWAEEPAWADRSKHRNALVFFVVLFFIGASIAGGLG